MESARIGLENLISFIHISKVNTKCMSLVDQWKKLKHPNVVSLRQVFTSKAFGDHSIIFVYDFYPGAETLMNKYLSHAAKSVNSYGDSYRFFRDFS